MRLAKQRFGEAARWRYGRPRSLRALVPAALRARISAAQGHERSSSERSSAGFTLIELVIVIGVMPLVIGAIAVGIISVFSLQSTVSKRLTDSGDAQVVSVNFQNDVQSAALITTSYAATNPGTCGTGFQVLGLQLGNKNQISYTTTTANGNGTTYLLTRNVCSGGSLTPTSSQVIARDLPSSVVQSGGSPVTVTCATGAAACLGTPAAYTTSWQSTVGVTGVTFNTKTPNGYRYQVVAVPAAGSNTTNLATPPAPSTGCGFATPGTGTYAATLCFVDFTPWSKVTSPPAANGNCLSGQLSMSAGIAATPFTISFCMSVTGSLNGNPITGQSSAPAACGVLARTGWNDISAVALPTYACPPGSEAFLGNNGFYTGVPGLPALYTVAQGSVATVTINHIQVLNSNGAAASNWELVTGDAESTDQSESITWTSDQKLSLLPNSPNSPIGNACDSTGQYAPPAYNSVTGLTGVNTTSVTCNATTSRDHTGTTMLQATTPTSLTVTLTGTGLQAMFLGVLLP